MESFKTPVKREVFKDIRYPSGITLMKASFAKAKGAFFVSASRTACCQDLAGMKKHIKVHCTLMLSSTARRSLRDI